MVKVSSNLAEITPEVLETEVNDTDLNFSGRESNKELGNFRLLGKSKHQQYFTPVEMCQTIFDMLSPLIADEKELSCLSVLDPTCGSGRLLLPWKKAGAQVMGIELDKDVALVTKRMLGKDNIRVGDILDYAPHLRDFSLAVSNPPYGICWNVSNQNIGFECANYGNSIESQSATIEIITQALKYAGILATIIPSTTFSNAKDSKLREHLFRHYNLLLRATINNLFNNEYGITGAVDLVIGQRNIDGMKGQAERLELDVLKDWDWQGKLCQAVREIIQEREISFYLSPANYVPVLNNLYSLPVNNQVAITPRGISGDISSLALLDFTNEVISNYNPIQGIQTGIIDAHLGSASLLKRGIEEAEEVLSHLGFEVSVKPADRKKIEQLKQRYDFLSVPLYHPKPHQLLAYFYDQEYLAKATVKDKEGALLFRKGKSYHLHPTWVRKKETVKIEEGFDESKKEKVTIKTEVDRGYLAIKVETEAGERVFNEIEVEEVKLLTEAFALPVINDVADLYAQSVSSNRCFIEKHLPFLFDYQKEDLSRLALKPFGYLGYEMGGGKTVASAAWAKIRGYKRVLIVCQSGLVGNWLNELKKFGFTAQRLTAHRSITKLQQERRDKIKTDDTMYYVTSYEFLSLDTGRIYDPWDCIEYDKDGNIRRAAYGITSEKCPECNRDYSSVIKACPKCSESESWTGNVCHQCGYRAYTYSPKQKSYPAYKRLKKMFSAVIVDEAQLAKAKNTGRGRAVRALKSKGKLILSGTLMKGYITDIFWNIGWILGFGNPLFPYAYRGGSKQFLNEFGTFEYTTKQFEDTLSEGRAKMIPEVSNLNRFWRIMSCFTIRRLKDEMVALPPKHKNILLLPMDTAHQEIYQQIQDWAQAAIQRAFAIANQTGGEVNMGLISSALWKLRFAATVPNAQSYLCKEPGPQVYLNHGQQWNKVGKILELTKDIQHKGEKLIIFSGLRPMVSAIIKALKDNQISFIPILASHKTSERFTLIEQFSNNENITAIVAGLNVLNRGFTITAANHVIITDLEYSPEATLQAEDRSHRTGQQKEVNVYYLFSQSTIDEDMFELISKKQAAISNAIDAKVSYTDVAQLLESASNIQLEVAKRIVAKTPQTMEVIKPISVVPVISVIPTPPIPSVAVSPVCIEQGNNLLEDLYQMRAKLDNKRGRKMPVISEQLFFDFG